MSTWIYPNNRTCIRNNLPIFFDAFSNATKAGGGFVAALKDIGKTIFSFGGLLTIGVTVVTLFADKIFGAGKKTEEAEKTLRKFKETFGTAFVGGDIEAAKEQIESYQNSLKQAIEATAQEASKVALIIISVNSATLICASIVLTNALL